MWISVALHVALTNRINSVNILYTLKQYFTYWYMNMYWLVVNTKTKSNNINEIYFWHLKNHKSRKYEVYKHSNATYLVITGSSWSSWSPWSPWWKFQTELGQEFSESLTFSADFLSLFFSQITGWVYAVTDLLNTGTVSAGSILVFSGEVGNDRFETGLEIWKCSCLVKELWYQWYWYVLDIFCDVVCIVMCICRVEKI